MAPTQNTTKRLVNKLGPIVVDGDEVELTVLAQSGTYIKELVHGDGGRTTPSVAGALGRECDVLWLDVVRIVGE
jgi:tRNA pseudouridine synthase 10